MRTRQRHRQASLRQMLLTWKLEHLLETAPTGGTYPEQVREALDHNIATNPDKWDVARRGREAIIEFFMTGPWRSDRLGGPAGDGVDDDAGDEDRQGTFAFTVGGHRMPGDLTFRDPTAGKSKMRTVSILTATIEQWVKAVELQKEKHDQAGKAITRNEAIAQELLRRAGNDPLRKISDYADVQKDQAA